MARAVSVENGVRRVIGDGESVPDGEVEGLGQDELLSLYRALVLLRTYDERSVVYHRQGRIGTYAIFWNREAMQVGSALALEERDWLFPSYRESAIGLLRGMPVSTVLSWWRGHPAGWWNPQEYGVASICVPIATHVPHAVGFAWGSRLKGEDRVAIAYFGDGATSEGAFHEGATFAGVLKAPAILFCNNNQWAISTPLSSQTAAPTLADKAIGYGLPGVRVDGGDVLAVYEATREAAERARAGDGPTFIEAISYRSAPHATADDPSIYIDQERVDEERESECVGRFRAYLERAGVLGPDDAAEIEEEALAAMREGIAQAEAEPPADPALVFEHAYGEPPPSLLAERDDLLGSLGGEGGTGPASTKGARG
jgi:pyruvate dehydrogenase E1 component alpha subunit